MNKLLCLLALACMACAQKECDCPANTVGENCETCIYFMIGASNASAGCPVDEDELQANLISGVVSVRDLVAAKQLGYDYPFDEKTLLCNFYGTYDFATQECACDPGLDPATDCKQCLADRNSESYPKCRPGCGSDPCAGVDTSCDDTEQRLKACPNNPANGAIVEVDLAGNYPAVRELFRVEQITSPKYIPVDEDCRVDFCSSCDEYSEECIDYETFDESTGETVQDKKCVSKLAEGEDGEDCVSFAYNEVKGKYQPQDVTRCREYETCCSGECCRSDQTCRERSSATAARYEWIDENGNQIPEEVRNRCSSYTMSTQTAVETYVQGFAVALAILVATVIVVCRCGLGSKLVSFSAIGCLLCCIVLSSYAREFIFVAIGSLTAIAAQKGDFVYTSVAVQLVLFMVCFCSVTFGTEIFQTRPLDLSRIFNSADCVDRFGYFNPPTADFSWDQDPEVEFVGLCSPEFMGSLAFFYVFAAVFYFLHMVGSASLTAGDKY